MDLLKCEYQQKIIESFCTVHQQFYRIEQRGPVYRRNCLNSVAFHQLTSAIALGFLANSIGIDFLKISKKSDIFCCTFLPILTFRYPKQNKPFYDTKTHKVHIVNWKLTDHANR